MKEKLEALKTAREYINKLKLGIGECVDYLITGEDEKGVSYIPQIAEGIGWLINVFSLTEDVHKEKIEMDGINEKLEEVVEGLENQDYMLVGDLFKYEILPILENMEKIINESITN